MKNNELLSERLEDNKDAVNWSHDLQERRKKGEEIAKELMEKYTPILVAIQNRQKV